MNHPQSRPAKPHRTAVSFGKTKKTDWQICRWKEKPLKIDRFQGYLSHIDEQLTVLPGELAPNDVRRKLSGMAHRHANRLKINQAVRELLAENVHNIHSLGTPYKSPILPTTIVPVNWLIRKNQRRRIKDSQEVFVAIQQYPSRYRYVVYPTHPEPFLL